MQKVSKLVKEPATGTVAPTADTSEPNKKNGSADTSAPTESIPFDKAVPEGKGIVAHNVEKTNAGRPLEIIAADIRALERGNAFAIGALLAEAREDAGYGEWSEWLESEFDWSVETARNYLAAHRLCAQDLQSCLCELDKFERVRLGEGKPKRRFVPRTS